MISGLCAGLAGVLSTARLGAAEPAAGTGFETFAIASAIIGGTSFFGGIGKIPKVVLGGLIIGIINNGINMVGLSSYYQQICMGSLIILAVTLDCARCIREAARTTPPASTMARNVSSSRNSTIRFLRIYGAELFIFHNTL